MTTSSPEVAFLRWPCEADGPRQRELLTERTPVLWIVESGSEPPACEDPLEDWVRPPLQRADLDARVSCLAYRAKRERAPIITTDNVLVVGDARLPLAESEAAIMSALVADLGSVVPRNRLVESGWGHDSDAHRNALDLRILRLRRRIANLQLEIVTVWGRGYMLEGP